MKRFKKFSMLSFMVGSLILSTNILAYANTTEASVSVQNSDKIIEPTDSYIFRDEELTSSTGSQSTTFDTTETYCYYRIYVENNSNVDYIVISPSGTSFTVKANGKKYIWSPKEVPAGTKEVSVTSRDGSKLNGHIAIRVADNLGEVEWN